MVNPQLVELAASSLFTHMQSEFDLADRTGGAGSSVDMAGPAITFHAADGKQTFPVQLIGSISKSAGTWMWGWHNVNSFPAAAITLAQKVREVGLERGIPELTTPIITLSETPSLLLELAAETIGVANHWVSVEAGNGVSVVLAVDAGDLPTPDGDRLIATLMRGVEADVVDDHRAALVAYAERVGLAVETLEDAPDSLRVTGPTGGVAAAFDAEGRLVSVDPVLPQLDVERDADAEQAEAVVAEFDLGGDESPFGPSPFVFGEETDETDASATADASADASADIDRDDEPGTAAESSDDTEQESSSPFGLPGFFGQSVFSSAPPVRPEPGARIPDESPQSSPMPSLPSLPHQSTQSHPRFGEPVAVTGPNGAPAPLPGPPPSAWPNQSAGEQGHGQPGFGQQGPHQQWPGQPGVMPQGAPPQGFAPQYPQAPYYPAPSMPPQQPGPAHPGAGTWQQPGGTPTTGQQQGWQQRTPMPQTEQYGAPPAQPGGPRWLGQPGQQPGQSPQYPAPQMPGQAYGPGSASGGEQLGGQQPGGEHPSQYPTGQYPTGQYPTGPDPRAPFAPGQYPPAPNQTGRIPRGMPPQWPGQPGTGRPGVPPQHQQWPQQGTGGQAQFPPPNPGYAAPNGPGNPNAWPAPQPGQQPGQQGWPNPNQSQQQPPQPPKQPWSPLRPGEGDGPPQGWPGAQR